MAASQLPVLIFLMLLVVPNLSLGHQSCAPVGLFHGKSHRCNTKNDSECCKSGKRYEQYTCSPPVTKHTKATMTLNVFESDEDGGGPAACDGLFHRDSEMVVALSTGWYDNGSRCHRKIRIKANGRSVLAKVVDECDSLHGCDPAHDFQPPCRNNIVDPSPAVWRALGIHGSQVGQMNITWSDA